MSNPTLRLDVLYSGMAPAKLALRSLMVLQAWIDDSKTGERVLVLAGYLAPHENWRQLTIEWDALLKEQPVWDEFKMRHAARYPDRAEKFYRLVEKYALAYVACVVDMGALRQICDELNLHDFFRNPYIYAIKAIMGATYNMLSLIDQSAPVTLDFIFDERGERKFVETAWEYFKLGLSEKERQRVGARPRFEKSIDFPALQTAEIMAWHLRRHWLKHGKFEAEISLPWKANKPVKGHLVHWDYEALKPNLESLRNLLIDMPDLPQAPFGILCHNSHFFRCGSF